VHYHQLTHANLEKLTYATSAIGSAASRPPSKPARPAADSRLQAAKQLQARLKLILEGEPPYDLFVRWKSLSKQAIGWHPDLNDGVRFGMCQRN
jgi:hypothetical protein